MHIAGDASSPHLCHQLQSLPKLLVASTLADDGGVSVNIAEVTQLMAISKAPQPVKQLGGPAVITP